MNRDWSERGLVRLQPGVGHVVQFGDASKLLVDGALRQFLEVVVHQGIRQGSGLSSRQPTAQELSDLRFAWAVCRHVKSNAIVFAKDGMLLGAGAGQMSRLDSSMIAAFKAGDRSQGGVVASDAFFPFRDGIDAAAKAGIKAAIQPGGSKNDDEVIAACNEHGIAMIFTGMRHFRH